MKLRRTAALSIALTLAGVLTACGGDDGDTSGSATTAEAGSSETTAAGAEAPADGAITVEGAWARTSPAAATNGAAYLTLTAAEDDALVGASVDPSVAAVVQVHETVMAEGSGSTMAGMSESTGSTMSGMAHDDDEDHGASMGDGAMTMREVEKIDLPAGEAVELKPGGYHIMLMELAEPLEKGSTIDITLMFENAAEMTISVPVQDAAP
ncbi:MAG: copper chaperone PCu(A)C [Acidimicrobiales bacterium]